MVKRYEVWVDDVRVGKRETLGRDYTHAIIGYRMDYNTETRESFRSTKLSTFGFSSSVKLAQAHANRCSPGARARVVPVTVVEKFTKVDAEGRRK